MTGDGLTYCQRLTLTRLGARVLSVDVEQDGHVIAAAPSGYYRIDWDGTSERFEDVEAA